MEAEFIKNVTRTRKLWRLSSPVSYTGYDSTYTCDYVITSAVSVLGEPETYIFPADGKGNIVGWSELRGSFKGDLNHQRAIDNLCSEMTCADNARA